MHMPKRSHKLDNIVLRILIMPYEDGYLAMCRETGLIRFGKTLVEAREAIFSSTQTLIEAVEKDNALLPSLSVGLPFNYLMLFDWTRTKMLLRFMIRSLYLVQPISGFSPDLL